MRLTKRMVRIRLGRHRGMTFVEVIASLLIVAMLSSATIAAGGLFLKSTQQITSYAKVKIYAVNMLERIQTDLEDGEVIDALDYNDTGLNSGVRADVFITDLGDVFGKSLYSVELRLRARGQDDTVLSQAVLREGSTAHAP